MIDKEKLSLSALIAEAAHFGQRDNGGVDTIYHVRYVSSQFADTTTAIVGMLHDVIEDSPLTTIEALEKLFNSEISQAVDAISRRKDEKYFDYIDRCKANPIARAVKIQDILHNLDKSRWPAMPESYEKREHKALEVLK